MTGLPHTPPRSRGWTPSSAVRIGLVGLALAAVIALLAATTGFRISTLAPAAYKASARCYLLINRGNAGSPRNVIAAPLCGTLEELAQSMLDPVAAARRADTALASPAYPLRVSANGRYLVDQHHTPFFMVGDSPQALIAAISEADAESFLANRMRAGFNSVWINLLCNDYTGCNPDGSTFDGIQPFSAAGDLSTPNEAYFARADRIIGLTAQYGINVLLDPVETGGWLGTLRKNGIDGAYRYGKFLGDRYKCFPNIVWMSGNDFQTWENPNDDALVRAVAQGIKETDTIHLQTVELNLDVSSSLDDSAWMPFIQLDAAYTYFPTYAEVLKEYQRPNYLPVFMVEANYEFEHAYAGPETLRRQEYWSLLSGAGGQLYGNKYTWQFIQGWKSRLDTLGSVEMGYVTDLFVPLRWYDLVPDWSHVLVSGGYGTFSSGGSVNDTDYLTAARSQDGQLAVAYIPTERSFTVNMAVLGGRVRARWYDPAAGTYTAVSGTPFANAGTREFHTPGRNADGDSDWVLLLEATG